MPADEASLYGLCQLYSCHALAYTMGSVWSTLEIHGNCSVEDIKRHCHIHLVFLEGGILGQLHRKPTIPRLMASSTSNTGPRIVVLDDSNDETPQMKDTNHKVTGNPDVDTTHIKDTVTSSCELNSASDHNYASPTPIVANAIQDDNTNNDTNRTTHQVSDDHNYAELSDVPTEPYSCNSDSQNDVVTTGGKIIICKFDKVEISLEYQCNNSLPEATKEESKSESVSLDKVTLKRSSDKQHVPDKTDLTSDEIDITNHKVVLLEQTDQHPQVLPDAPTLPDVSKELLDATESNNKILTDKISSEGNMLLDKTHNQSTISDLSQFNAISSSTGPYPETTESAIALTEATESTTGTANRESETDTNSNLNVKDQTTTTTDNENNGRGSVNLLPGKTIMVSPTTTGWERLIRTRLIRSST